MSIAPTNVQLAPLPSTTPTSPVASTSTQSSPASSSPAGNQNQITASAGASPGANNNSPNTISSNIATSQQAKHGLLWQKIRRVCVFLAKLLFALVGGIIAYLALSTALWSSAKDYRDDCRDQDATYGYISRACTEALHSALSRPLGLSMFITKSEHDRQGLERRNQLPGQSDGNSQTISVIRLLILTAGFCVTCLAMASYYLRRSRKRPNLKARQTSYPGSDRCPTVKYTAWVESPVAKQVDVMTTTWLGADSTDLRQRLVRHLGAPLNESNKEKRDWLNASPTGVKHTTRSDDEVLRDTVDEDSGGETLSEDSGREDSLLHWDDSSTDGSDSKSTNIDKQKNKKKGEKKGDLNSVVTTAVRDDAQQIETSTQNISSIVSKPRSNVGIHTSTTDFGSREYSFPSLQRTHYILKPPHPKYPPWGYYVRGPKPQPMPKDDFVGF